MTVDFARYTKSYWKHLDEEGRKLVTAEHLERAKNGRTVWNNWNDKFNTWINQNKIFDAHIYFDGVNFEPFLNFVGYRFCVSTSFKGARFGSEKGGFLDFSGAQFSEGVDFEGAEFFGGGATFKGAIFEYQGRKSKGPRFNLGANFSHTTFRCARLYFDSARFDGGVSFQKAKFLCLEADFIGTLFRKDTNFIASWFRRRARFVGATFTGDRATFDGINSFGRHAVFDGATFSSAITTFTNTNFHNAFFEQAVFTRPCLFEETTFTGICNCENAEFQQTVSFAKSTFVNVPEFNFGSFKQPPDLYQMSIPWIDNNIESEANAQRYRKLKLLAKEAGDHEQELKFFAYEMRSKLAMPEIPAHLKAGISLYHLVSDFGQNLLRPLVLLAVFFCLSSGLQLAFMAKRPSYPDIDAGWSMGCSADGSKIDPVAAVIRERLSHTFIFLPTDRTERALVAECLYGDEQFVPAKYQFLNRVHFVLSAVFLFLFGLAARNRFRIR